MNVIVEKNNGGLSFTSKLFLSDNDVDDYKDF